MMAFKSHPGLIQTGYQADLPGLSRASRILAFCRSL